MSTTYQIEVQVRDPLIARDGRPFGTGQGSRMRSLDWLLPSVLAGSFRSLVGKTAGGFDPSMVQSLKDLEIAGPFPVHESHLYFPTPRDALLQSVGPGQEKHLSIRPTPLGNGEGTDLPNNLQPCLPPAGLRKESKPPPIPQWWSAKQFSAWLTDSEETPRDIETGASRFPFTTPRDTRTHVRIDPQTGTSSDGDLFTTTALDLSVPPASCCSTPALSMALRVTAPPGSPLCNHFNALDALHPVGGERRIAHWRRDKTTADRWACPAGIIEAIGRKPQRLRLILATPAIFAKGWRPGWLQPIHEGLVGKPPSENDKPGPQLKLVGAVVGRWQPISGWSLEAGKRGIKPLRRLAPAGSVFFFEVLDGSNPADWVAAHWLSSVCDDAQDRRDGFGLAAWGIWSPHNLSP
jgi:CRISPR-associated protein Cmr3